jgi:hypothetical protein
VPALQSQTRLRTTVVVLLLVALAATLVVWPSTARALTAKSYSVYLGETRPVLRQWWQGLENWQGTHFLVEPVASNTENASEVQQLLHQWWDGLEARRGSHFLNEPVGSNIDSAPELHQLLNQWQNAIEAWRGSHFLQEPPSPFSSFTVTKTGSFGLTPKRAAVRPGRRFSYEVRWTVPRPNNWHDLRTIDLRVCRSGAVVWIRWRELTNTLSLLSSRGRRVIARGEVGASRVLRSPTVLLSLADSSTTGSGETGRRVTLELALRFRARMRGRECGVQLAARDDLGNRDGFERAGRIRIRQG